MKILISKSFDFNNINIVSIDTEFTFERNIQEYIDGFRHQKIIESQEKAKPIWDGLNYNLTSYSIVDDMLTLEVGTVRFRNISLYGLLPGYIKQAIGENQPKGLFVAGIIQTADGYFLFPKRGTDDVLSPGNTTTFGGVLQPDDLKIKSFSDIWKHMKTELKEESGIPDQHIEYGIFIGLTVSKALNRGIIFYITLNITKEVVLDLFGNNDKKELDELICVPQQECFDFLTMYGYNKEGCYISNLGLYRDLLLSNKIL